MACVSPEQRQFTGAHLMQMPQLVRIAHHVERGNPAILGIEGRRLQFAVSVERDAV
jgi:hypothetical protein